MKYWTPIDTLLAMLALGVLGSPAIQWLGAEVPALLYPGSVKFTVVMGMQLMLFAGFTALSMETARRAIKARLQEDERTTHIDLITGTIAWCVALIHGVVISYAVGYVPVVTASALTIIGLIWSVLRRPLRPESKPEVTPTAKRRTFKDRLRERQDAPAWKPST